MCGRRWCGLVALLGGSLQLAVLDVLPLIAQPTLVGELGVETRLYPEDPLVAGQPRRFSASARLQPEVTLPLADELTLRSIVRARVDQSDPKRTYVDLREALLQWDRGRLLTSVGINTVFWGVTESRHLVDVVNQTDYLDDLDGDAKLGQLMALATYEDARLGLFDLFVMTAARAQRYPSGEGRPGVPVPVLHDSAVYASALAEWHVDLAIRWSHHLGPIDWAVSLFRGTARDPELIAEVTAEGPALRPRYDVIGQGGLEMQWTEGDWLWKAEAIVRSGQGPTFLAVTGGFERTSVGVVGTAADLGVLLEYSYDGRDNRTLSIHDEDLFGGLRLTLNDTGGTEVLAGALWDVESGATFTTIEASRRLADRWTLSLTGRLFAASDEADPLFWFRRDDYVQLELARYF